MQTAFLSLPFSLLAHTTLILENILENDDDEMLQILPDSDSTVFWNQGRIASRRHSIEIVQHQHRHQPKSYIVPIINNNTNHNREPKKG